MNNNVIMQGRDFSKYIQYFGLKEDFTIEELERKKYIKEKEDSANLKLEDMYKALLEVKLNDLSKKNGEISKGELHREEFVKGFKEMYDTNYPKYSNKDNLNNRLTRVKSYVNAINKDNNITQVYDGYVSNVKSFMDVYATELDENNHLVISDVINEKKDNVTLSISTMLNSSLDKVISDFNSEIKMQVIKDNEANYLLRVINLAFKDVQSYYGDSKLDGVIGKYRDEIDTFLETKYNYYIRVNNNVRLDNEEEKKIAKENFFKDFQSSILSYFTALFKKVYAEVKEDLDAKKANGTIDNSLYTVMNIQLKKATNLGDLASVYNRVNGEIKVVKFA